MSKVLVRIPAQFYAEVDVTHDDDGNVTARSIGRFIVTPSESFAGYFGAGAEAVCVTEAEEGLPLEGAESAAVDYWKACNDGTWPLDKIDWEE